MDGGVTRLATPPTAPAAPAKQAADIVMDDEMSIHDKLAAIQSLLVQYNDDSPQAFESVLQAYSTSTSAQNQESDKNPDSFISETAMSEIKMEPENVS